MLTRTVPSVQRAASMPLGPASLMSANVPSPACRMTAAARSAGKPRWSPSCRQTRRVPAQGAQHALGRQVVAIGHGHAAPSHSGCASRGAEPLVRCLRVVRPSECAGRRSQLRPATDGPGNGRGDVIAFRDDRKCPASFLHRLLDEMVQQGLPLLPMRIIAFGRRLLLARPIRRRRQPSCGYLSSSHGDEGMPLPRRTHVHGHGPPPLAPAVSAAMTVYPLVGDMGEHATSAPDIDLSAHAPAVEAASSMASMRAVDRPNTSRSTAW